MVKKPKTQQTVIVPDYGIAVCNRLAVILRALEQMDERERGAVFGYLKATYRAEWPSDPYT